MKKEYSDFKEKMIEAGIKNEDGSEVTEEAFAVLFVMASYADDKGDVSLPVDAMPGLVYHLCGSDIYESIYKKETPEDEPVEAKEAEPKEAETADGMNGTD